MLISPRYDGPPIISIVGRPDDQLVPVTRQRRRFESTLAGLPADAWRAPTRCAGWTVHDVVAHLTDVNNFWHASVRAGLAGTPTRILAGFDPAATPEFLAAQMRELAPGEVFERFQASNDALLGVLAELDDHGWTMLAEAPPGHLPIRLLAHHALWDAWIHERDVELPLGRTPTVEPDEVASSLRYAAALSPAFFLSGGDDLRGSFAVDANDPALQFTLDVSDSVAVRDDIEPAAPCLGGDAVELLEAVSLRCPLPADAPVAWQDLLQGLTTAFT
jgi:uncharacterized protein (TIGR03083 family)